MSILALPMSLDDLEMAWLKEQYAEGYGKTGKVIAARNMLRNPNAEVDISGISALNLAVNTRDTVEKFSGASSVKCVTPGTVVNEGCYFTTNALRMLKGKSYRGSGRVKGPVGVTIRILAAQQKADGSFAIASANYVLTGNWDFLVTPVLNYNDQEPMPASGCSVQFATVTAPQAITFYVDCAVLQETTAVPEFFDGSTTDNNVFTYDWEGTPNNSSSIKWSREPVIGENFFPNPYAVNDDLSIWTKARGVLSFETDNPIGSGNRCWKFVSDGVVGAGFAPVINNGTYTGFSINVYPGMTLDTDVVINLDSNTYFRVEVGWNTPGGPVSTLGSIVGPGFKGKYSFTHTAPAGTTGLINIIYRFGPSAAFAANSPAGTTVLLSDIFVGTGEPSGTGKNTGDVFNSSIVYTDVNARDHAFLEKTHWAKTSGLVEPASLNDHKLAALRNATGLSVGTLTDIWIEYLKANSGLGVGPYSYADHEYAFYKLRLGL